MDYVYAVLAGAAAVVVAQGLGKYNLTTYVLWFFGLAAKYEATLAAKAKKVANGL